VDENRTFYIPNNMQHARCHLFQGSILPLNNSIFLQSIGNCVLELNPDLKKNILYLMVDIIPPIICLEDFDLPSSLPLNKGFEIFEMLKDLRFFHEKESPSVA
jgi:hypothetical protein